MTPPCPPWDDDDDEPWVDPDRESSPLSAFDDYSTGHHDDDDPTPEVSFTVNNPDGTVAVTALLGGRTLRVDLSPHVTSMTERELAEEISVLAELATQKALAAQHGVVSTLMQEMGHARAVVSDFLERDIGLPSPEKYVAHATSVFSDRYQNR